MPLVTVLVQQIDDHIVIDRLQEHSTGCLTATVGSFVNERSPIMWVASGPADTRRDARPGQLTWRCPLRPEISINRATGWLGVRSTSRRDASSAR